MLTSINFFAAVTQTNFNDEHLQHHFPLTQPLTFFQWGHRSRLTRLHQNCHGVSSILPLQSKKGCGKSTVEKFEVGINEEFCNTGSLSGLY